MYCDINHSEYMFAWVLVCNVRAFNHVKDVYGLPAAVTFFDRQKKQQFHATITYDISEIKRKSIIS